MAIVGSGATVNINSSGALQGYELELTDTSSIVNFGGAVTSGSFGGLYGTGNPCNLVLTNTAGNAVALTLQGLGNFSNAAPGEDNYIRNYVNISGLGGLTITSVSDYNHANGGTAEFDGNLSFTGTAGLNVSNTGSIYSGTGNYLGSAPVETVVLTGSNTYTGPTQLGFGATIDVGSNGGSGTLGTGAIVNNGGTLVFNSSGSSTVAGISGSGGSVTLAAGNVGALTILGSGLSFTGTMTVQGGALALGNGASLGTGITVTNAGSELDVIPGVNGVTTSLSGTLSLGVGATFSMADGATSTFQVPSATIGGSNSLIFDLGGSASDVLAISGTGADGAGIVITLNAVSPLTGTTYNIITSGTGLTAGNFSLASNRVVLNGTGGTAYGLALSGTSTVETVTVTGSGVTAAYFTGKAGNLALNATTSGTTNFSTSSTGSPDLGGQPSPYTDVYFTANNVVTSATISSWESVRPLIVSPSRLAPLRSPSATPLAKY